MKEKENFYYKYISGRQSIFEAVRKWIDLQTKKRYGWEWAEENRKLTKEINKSIKWLPEYKEDKKIKYYFTKKGVKRYEKTLFKIHKRLIKRKISKKKFKFFIRKIGREFVVYNKENNKKVGELVHKDKFQIGIKIK